MSIDIRAKQYGKIFGDWSIREFIGSGSSGKTGIFRIVRTHDGWPEDEECALKVVTIIEEFGVLNQFSEKYQQEYQVERKNLCEAADKEVHMMYKLRGHPNIVQYLDSIISNWEEENKFGCDLLIRMDILCTLESLRKNNTGSEADVIQIGKDICRALIQCDQENIVHRDIKPGNIFVKKHGKEKTFQLGDFGIARILENSQKASTSIGTYAYAAPEQFYDKKYGKSVDIYSLGLTLYELSNRNCLPFAESIYVRTNDIQKRLIGKPFPTPCNASATLAQVILKSCAYKPEDRFQSPKEFLMALEEVERCNLVLASPSASIRNNTEQSSMPTFQEITDPYATVAAKPLAKNSKVLSDMSQVIPDTNVQASNQYLERAKQGEVKAQYFLANCFYYGIDVEQNYEEAIKWFQKAADQGFADAQFKLGNAYYFGNGVGQNYAKAFEWYIKAAKQGHADAQYSLGVCYERGLGVNCDAVKAAEWYQKAANQGHIDAQYNLGGCYYDGFGVKQSDIEAVKWYQKAAEQGHVDAQYNLGVCYQGGFGVRQDNIKATKWYQRAAEQENEEKGHG